MSKGRPPSFRWPVSALPRLRFAGHVPFDPRSAAREYRHATVALHQHFYHARLVVEGCPPVVLRPGDVTYTPPHAVSRYELREAGHHWCLHFDPLPPGRRAAAFPLHLSPGAGAAYVADRFRAVADLYIRGEGRAGRLAREAASLSAQELILWLALRPDAEAAAAPRSRKRERGLERVRALLHERFRDPPSAAELAREAGLSRNYLAARFRERFGMTIDAYLLRRRVDLARHLLASTDMPVKEVAWETGLADPQYFNKRFRRLAGMSPTAFRARGEPRAGKVVE